MTQLYGKGMARDWTRDSREIPSFPCIVFNFAVDGSFPVNQFPPRLKLDTNQISRNKNWLETCLSPLVPILANFPSHPFFTLIPSLAKFADLRRKLFALFRDGMWREGLPRIWDIAGITCMYAVVRFRKPPRPVCMLRNRGRWLAKERGRGWDSLLLLCFTRTKILFSFSCPLLAFLLRFRR